MMNVSIFFSLFCVLFSSTAFSCPEIGGTYKECKSVTGWFNRIYFSIEQTRTEGIDTFILSDYPQDVFRSTGVKESMASFDDITLHSITTCTKEEVKIKFWYSSPTFHSGRDIRGTWDFSKSGKKLFVKMDTNFYGSLLQDVAICE